MSESQKASQLVELERDTRVQCKENGEKDVVHIQLCIHMHNFHLYEQHYFAIHQSLKTW